MITKRLIYFIILAICFTHQNFAQDFEISEKSITGIFEAPNKTNSEIFSAINKWISLNYNSAKSVVQLNDKDAGNIIVKGINKVKYDNVWKELYPNNKYLDEESIIKFNHTIEINIKDEKFRVIYSLTDLINDSQHGQYDSLNDLVFKLINLEGLQTESVEIYSNFIDSMLKKGLVGKKKRAKIEEMIEPSFEQLTQNLTLNIKTTMFDIKKSMDAYDKDDW